VGGLERTPAEKYIKEVMFSKCHGLLPLAKLRASNLAFSGWTQARNRKLLINDRIDLKGFSPPPLIERTGSQEFL
jgi:hypothetical protein